MKNGYDDPKVTPISAARRKQAAASGGLGAARAQARSRTARDWVIGGVFLAMAAGMVVYGGLAAYHWLSTLAR